MPDPNYLIIGLGGSGCAVIRELKKKLYSEWRARGNSGAYPDMYEFERREGSTVTKSRVATLSIDSNKGDLGGEGQDWRVFGRSLSLRDGEKRLISHEGVSTMMADLDRHPGVSPWLTGEEQFVRAITAGGSQLAGCNQIRRLGRLALANGGNISQVMGDILRKLGELKKDSTESGYINIYCTLAGGTGSGSVLDIVAQLQKKLTGSGTSGNYEVCIHAFVSNAEVGAVNTGNFYANQYAALTELNAFRRARYAPWDISEEISPRRLTPPRGADDLPTNTGSGLAIANTYKSVILISDRTNDNVNVPFKTQVDNAAEYVFQTAVRRAGALPDNLRKAVTSEDRNQYPEDARGSDRSTSFSSYGVHRLAIPEREIREKLSYSFARQYLLAMRYGNWVSDHYQDVPRQFAVPDFVKKKRSLWKLTQDHLWLDIEEQIAGKRQPKTYHAEWSDTLKAEAGDIIDMQGKEFAGRTKWITELDLVADMIWHKGFRGQGVDAYFKAKSSPNELTLRVQELRRNVEEELLSYCEGLTSDDDPPLCHLPGIVNFLIQRIEEDKSYFGKVLAEAPNRYQELDKEKLAITEVHGQVGKLFTESKHRDLFAKYQTAAIESYYWRTAERAAQYGVDFCDKFREALAALEADITLFDTRVGTIVDNFAEAATALIGENEAANAKQQQEQVNYLVDATAVNLAIRDRFERDMTIQKRSINQIMNTLKVLRGDKNTFAAYLKNMPADNKKIGGLLVEELRRISEERAIEEHNTLLQNTQDTDDFKDNPLLGQNIIHKLYKQYGGNVEGELTAYLRELVGKSAPMLAFDATQTFTIDGIRGPVLRRFVFLPQCPAVPPQFSQELKAVLAGIMGDGGGRVEVTPVEVYEESPDIQPNELVFISAVFFFPARCASVVQGLRAKYDTRMRSNERDHLAAKRAYFETHTESHQVKLPNLMLQGIAEMREERFPIVLLATSMGLMSLPEQAEKEVIFGEKDGFGRIADKVSSGMTATAEMFDIAEKSESRFGRAVPLETVVLYKGYFGQFRDSSFTALEGQVKKHLGQDDVDLKGLVARLDEMAGEVFLLSGKNEDDTTYNQVLQAAKAAQELARILADKSRA